MNPIKKLAVAYIRKHHAPHRRITAKFRVLPDYIIIGSMKCGTTSLFKYLEQHLQILPGVRKEVNFFDLNHERGEYWYRSCFPLKTNVKPGQITGEASPRYISHPHVAARIKALIPDARLICVLRNPVERTISHYFHNLRRGRETLPVMEALQAEEERTEADWQKMQENEHFLSYPCFHFSYKRRGVYIEQLERYWQVFPKEQLLLLSSEAFFSDPQATLGKVFDFLGVDTDFQIPNLSPHGVGTNRTKVEPVVYEYLEEYFKGWNQKLYEKSGQDFGWL